MKNRSIILVSIVFLLVITGFTACVTGEKSSVQVQRIDTTAPPTAGNAMVYGLPEKHLAFTIQAIRKERVPGPYHQYGEKLLGLDGIPHQNEVKWQIGDIAMQESRGIDYDHLYRVKPRGKFHIDWERFTRQGWIIPFDGKGAASPKSDFYRVTGPEEEVLYTDLSVRRFVGKETKTVYERVWRDSIYARVPREKTETVKKTKQQKASEAASFIFMIREKRFELISGMGDYYPDGKALQAALDEMQRLEKQYIALFKGKTFRDTLTYTIRLTPRKVHLEEPGMLFRFSEEKGVLEAGKQEGAPVWLDITLREDPGRLRRLVSRETKGVDSSLFYYRLPVESLLELKYGDQVIARKYLEIDQFGPVFRMPAEFLNRSGFIRFPADDQQP